MTRIQTPLRVIGLALCAALALSACSRSQALSKSSRPVFDGQYFRMSLAAEKDTPANFVVTVRDASKSLAGARDAGRYEAANHCIERFGSSRIDWMNGPDAPDEALQFSGGDLVFSGVCRGW
ncbi:hypothetical protein [Oceanicola sp. S124]|uniref:hypothetical protein n=1 Tax=Oceanicola sp. S124 TaxID=1042378 RepID=UPI00058E7A54|nr:hypothetical protein [Oceanicola sp. S124]